MYEMKKKPGAKSIIATTRVSSRQSLNRGLSQKGGFTTSGVAVSGTG